MRNVAGIALAVLLAGCAAGPGYTPPATTAAAEFAGGSPARFSTAAPEADFWAGFDDPVLTRLVEDALAANTDLRVALARLDRARAVSRESRLDLLPAVTAGGGFTSTQVTAAQAALSPRGRSDEVYSGSIDAFWEVDLFGRVRRAVDSRHAEAGAAAADLQALQVSTAAEVARTYMQLRGAQERLRVAQDNAENQRGTLRLTESLLNAGRGTEFDTARARAQLESTLALIPALEAEIAVATHRLAVLNGREPAALREDLADPVALPALPRTVAVGTPTDLLRRRPDIQAAERRLAAATARIGVASADLFPRLVLNGTLSTTAFSFGDLFTGASEGYAAGPSISWAFLDMERVRARIAAADADAEGAMASYEGAVLRALEESENALVTYDRALRETGHLRESAVAAADAVRLARARFESGVADFLEVLDAERSLLEAEGRLAQSQTRAATALVAVYKAVAGGWPERMPQRLADAGRADFAAAP